MVKVIVQFRDRYNETRVFYPGDLLEIEDESRKCELLERGLVVEAVPKVLKKIEAESEQEDKGDTEQEVESEAAGIEMQDLDASEIKARLDERGIRYDKRLSKEKLVKLLEEKAE